MKAKFGKRLLCMEQEELFCSQELRSTKTRMMLQGWKGTCRGICVGSWSRALCWNEGAKKYSENVNAYVTFEVFGFATLSLEFSFTTTNFLL